MKELNLETFVTNFRRERIVLVTIMSMNDEQIERLGVTAIGDRVRLRAACRDFEDGSTGVSSDGGRSVATTSARGRPSAERIREERMRLFNPKADQFSIQKQENSTGTNMDCSVCLLSRQVSMQNTIGRREANLT